MGKEINAKTWRQRVSEYLQEYIRFTDNSYISKDLLSDEGIAAGIACLLGREVFEDAEELKQDILQSKLVIVSDEFFGEYLKP